MKKVSSSNKDDQSAAGPSGTHTEGQKRKHEEGKSSKTGDSVKAPSRPKKKKGTYERPEGAGKVKKQLFEGRQGPEVVVDVTKEEDDLDADLPQHAKKQATQPDDHDTRGGYWV